MPQFIDQIGGVGGTPLNAAALDAEVVASSYLVSGGIPTTFNNFVITQPATSAVINAGAGSAVYVPAGGGVVAACQLTMTASSDNYVDLLPTGAAFPASGVGAYVITAVANGAGAPALTSGNMRLYKAVSGGGAVTSILALGTTYPVSVAMVPAGVASGLATLDATAHVTPAQLNLGVASGLATLDSSSRVVQNTLHGVTAYKAAIPTATITPINAIVYTTLPSMPTITLTLPTGNLFMRVSVFLGPNDSFPGSYTVNSFDVLTFGFTTGGATTTIGSIQGTIGYGVSGSMPQLFPGYAAAGSTVTFTLQYNVVGSGSFKCQAGTTQNIVWEVWDAN